MLLVCRNWLFGRRPVDKSRDNLNTRYSRGGIWYFAFFSAIFICIRTTFAAPTPISTEVEKCNSGEEVDFGHLYELYREGIHLAAAKINYECAKSIIKKYENEKIRELVLLAGFADIYFENSEKSSVEQVLATYFSVGSSYAYENVQDASFSRLTNTLSKKLRITEEEAASLTSYIFREKIFSEMDLFKTEYRQVILYTPVRHLNRALIKKICDKINCKKSTEPLDCSNLDGILLKKMYFENRGRFEEEASRCFPNTFSKFSTMRIFGIYDGRCSIVGQMNLAKVNSNSDLSNCDKSVAKISESGFYTDIDGIFYVKNWKYFIEKQLIDEIEHKKNIAFISAVTGIQVEEFLDD